MTPSDDRSLLTGAVIEVLLSQVPEPVAAGSG